MSQPPILERAFELARGGEHRSVSTLREQLRSEGYVNVEMQLSGRSLSSQLQRLCREAALRNAAG